MEKKAEYKANRVEIKPLIPGNIRSAMDGAALAKMELSMNKDGQQVPILITSTGRILDGHRRVTIALKLGWTHIWAVEVGEDMTPEQVSDFQTLHGFHSESLSDYDKAHALKAKADSAGLNNKQLAEHFSIDPSEVTLLKSLFDCIPAVQEMAARGELGRSKWYAISKSPDQEATLELVRSGVTRDELAQRTRKAKASSTPAVRASKIPIRLPSGVTITVAGQDSSLDDVIEHLAEAAKLAKKARDQGLDAKTAVRVWADMAAAG